MPLFLFRGCDEKFQCLLGALHRREAAIGARQQQCAFELAEHQCRDQIGLFRTDAETLQPAFDFVFPALESATGRGAQRVGNLNREIEKLVRLVSLN